MKKSILIINTGGTLSCIKTASGYEPAPGYVQKALSEHSALKHADMPEFCIKEFPSLLDSSNMTLHDWNSIAQNIYSEYANYDGFVIFHGTDTMAFTASALSFMLEHLGKPVIITGSQIPLSEVRNDAIDNVMTSLWLCAHHPIREVCIYFGKHLLRGNRAQKISTQGLNAFASPNFPELATIGTNIELQSHLLLEKSSMKPFNLQSLSPQYIANFRLFPGFSTDVLAFILNQPLRGLILETYGTGNAPNRDPNFIKLLQEACLRGIVIINCTQCHQGRVEMSQYATGFTLKEIGLISGHDMTPEAAHCKLLYLLSKNMDFPQVKLFMERNLCGEMLEPAS
ncbi:MAG: asparaginase [Legionella sp.]|nr:asparaginase [Legionella sp.]